VRGQEAQVTNNDLAQFSSGERYGYTVARASETNFILIIAPNAGQNDNLIFLTLIIINGDSFNSFNSLPGHGLPNLYTLPKIHGQNRDLLILKLSLHCQILHNSNHHFDLIKVDLRGSRFLVLLVTMIQEIDRVFDS